MIKTLINAWPTRHIAPLISAAERGLYYGPYLPDRNQTREIERCFTRLFLSEDGQKVLAHLQTISFQRVLGAGAGDDELRYMEGQRAMIATILRLIDRGRKV